MPRGTGIYNALSKRSEVVVEGALSTPGVRVCVAGRRDTCHLPALTLAEVLVRVARGFSSRTRGDAGKSANGALKHDPVTTCAFLDVTELEEVGSRR